MATSNFMCLPLRINVFFFISVRFCFSNTSTAEIYTLSLHDALPIFQAVGAAAGEEDGLNLLNGVDGREQRSEEHTSELQSLRQLVCRLLLEKNKTLV